MWKDRLRDIQDKIVKNRKVLFPLLVIIVVAFALTIVFNMGDKREQEVLPAELTLKGEPVVDETVQETDENLEEVSEDVSLKPNEDAAITALITTYYNAMASGDEETLRSICDVFSDADMLRTVETAKYIESYPELDIYTKKGPEEGSTIAFVYYKVVFANHEEQFPGYQAYYICTNENGELYIKRGDNSDEVNEYIQKINSQDDVIEFNNRIQVEYNEFMEAHPELLEYLNELSIAVNTAMGETLAEQVSAENPENTEETVNEGEGENSEAQGTDTENNQQEQPQTENVVQYASTTATVNVRASDSEKAEKLGKASQGSTFQIVEQQVNGWTKILYEGKEGFIKSEYLKLVENADSSAAIGTVTATTNINVRAEASETADRLGVLAGGESIELLANENGWCKVNYNGRVGYVKADYVE
ncbi:MAG: SH3 domain-containing protein [Lachnospiraceae bacterium]|nr:SH3 domain-containing protein [Lachnospiraceae bacterium]